MVCEKFQQRPAGIFQGKFPSLAYFSVPRHENITRKVTSIISRPFIQDEQRHRPSFRRKLQNSNLSRGKSIFSSRWQEKKTLSLSFSFSPAREMRNSRVSARVLPATFEKKPLVQLPSPLNLHPLFQRSRRTALKLKANPNGAIMELQAKRF